MHHCNFGPFSFKVVNSQSERGILHQSTLFTFGAKHLQPGLRHPLHMTVVNKRLLELIGNVQPEIPRALRRCSMKRGKTLCRYRTSTSESKQFTTYSLARQEASYRHMARNRDHARRLRRRPRSIVANDDVLHSREVEGSSIIRSARRIF